MPRFAIIAGAALLLLGVGSYIVTGMASWTALIPSIFGVPILLCGLVGQQFAWRKHAMHVAAALALLGLLGSVMGVPKAITLMTGGSVERPAAAVAQAIMAVICAAFVAWAVKSFIDARRTRDPAAGVSS